MNTRIMILNDGDNDVKLFCSEMRVIEALMIHKQPRMMNQPMSMSTVDEYQTNDSKNDEDDGLKLFCT